MVDRDPIGAWDAVGMDDTPYTACLEEHPDSSDDARIARVLTRGRQMSFCHRAYGIMCFPVPFRPLIIRGPPCEGPARMGLSREVDGDHYGVTR